VLVKLNGSDFLPGGLAVEDAVAAAKALDAEGIDAIEVSGGTPASGDRTPVRTKIDRRDQEGFNVPLAAKIKAAVRCPVMVVGGIRSFDLAQEILDRGQADYLSLARPLVREPGLVARWQAGETSRSRCISCNGCYRPGLREGGIYCVVEKAGRKKGEEAGADAH
jgi:2,4-dienoyl-CoA reductase-like NADH-dependent reductase (Old Yellow Enzyme family)